MDAGLEIEARRTQRASILLVGAAHVASTGLRTVVRESGSLRLVAEVSAGPNAVSAAKQWQPDHILVAADGMTDEIITVKQQLRRTSPGSTMVVCTDRFRPDVLLAAGQIPVEAILRGEM
jgi:DNA-binding NarL/FixJ family response regulator